MVPTQGAFSTDMAPYSPKWNHRALHVGFQNGLSDQIKDELVVMDDLAGWDSLISLTTRLDNVKVFYVSGALEFARIPVDRLAVEGQRF